MPHSQARVPSVECGWTVSENREGPSSHDIERLGAGVSCLIKGSRRIIRRDMRHTRVHLGRAARIARERRKVGIPNEAEREIKVVDPRTHVEEGRPQHAADELDAQSSQLTRTCPAPLFVTSLCAADV